MEHQIRALPKSVKTYFEIMKIKCREKEDIHGLELHADNYIQFKAGILFVKKALNFLSNQKANTN